ncbi:hypothetical protein RN001_008796 [Aquatica leii]|uniref:Amino acid transporter transmembrane domain-containing protein n=1 Tax=Aquatica leii TaxID=1421715 RepID=A0AAN7SRH7_9COLE|nr:hypothetical protein RN001_008796 [Aquatica leii]
MQTPKSFGGYFGVLNFAMFFITLLYAGIGFLGYWRYGEETRSSITLNLENQDLLAKLVLGVYSVAIFISYGLQGFVPVDIMWNRYLCKRLSHLKHAWICEYTLRAALVIVTGVAGDWMMLTVASLLALTVAISVLTIWSQAGSAGGMTLTLNQAQSGP